LATLIVGLGHCALWRHLRRGYFVLLSASVIASFSSRKTSESLDDLTVQEEPCAISIPTDLRRDLIRALEQLTSPYREVLILRDVHELTAPEVAAQLGLSLEAVKSRLHRARAMVRKHLLAGGYWLKDGAPEPIEQEDDQHVL